MNKIVCNYNSRLDYPFYEYSYENSGIALSFYEFEGKIYEKLYMNQGEEGEENEEKDEDHEDEEHEDEEDEDEDSYSDDY